MNSDDVVKSMREKIPNIYKKIGTTTYEVSMNFSVNNKEGMEEKIERLIQNELNNIKTLTK